MNDDLRPEDEFHIPAMPEPLDSVLPDVEFVVPAAAYVSIATEGPDALLPARSVGHRDEGPSKTLEAVRVLGETLQGQLEALRNTFEREIRAEATREKVVDRLHAELQEYKQDLLLNVLRPVFVDLIQLHDDIGKITAAQADSGGEAGRLLDLMRGFQQGIEDILYRQGVEPYLEEGGVFDPRRQRAVSTVPTDDPALNKAIAARHRKGFRAGEKVIRPEVVSVFAFKK